MISKSEAMGKGTPSNPKLAVIIVSYNAAEYLRQCLASAMQYLGPLPAEIAVVDNASSDGTAQMVEKEYPDVQLIRNPTNRGFSAAVNQGLKETTAPFVLWLNPDSLCRDGNLKDLIAYLETEKEIGILGPQILDPQGTVQLSCRSFPTLTTYFFGRFSILTQWFPNNPYSQRFLHSGWDHSTRKDVDWVSGACLLHRRELIVDIGPLDEKYFMYFEDVDFCQRAKAKGWRVQYHPGSQFLHHIAGSSRKRIFQMLIQRHQSNWHYYTKYFKRNILKDTFIALGLMLRCVVQILFAGFQKRGRT